MKWNLCNKTQILNRILWCTGSRWSFSWMAAEIRSYFRIFRNRRGAEWRTDCSGRRWTVACTIESTVTVVNSTHNRCVHQGLCRILRQHDGELTRAAEADRTNFRTTVVCVCVKQMSAPHPAPHPSNVPQLTLEFWLYLVRHSEHQTK